MPIYQIRWTNRSAADQDWQISNGDNFTLRPNYVRQAQVTIHNDYTFGIAVTTNGGIAAANLTYTAETDSWALTSHTPHQWGFGTIGNTVTVRCLLENVNVLNANIEYNGDQPLHEKDLVV